MNDSAERGGEAISDAVHASDGLEHGGLPIDLLLVELSLGKIGGQQFADPERLMQSGLCKTGSTRCAEAGARGADVITTAVEIAKAAEEVQEPGDVLLRER